MVGVIEIDKLNMVSLVCYMQRTFIFIFLIKTKVS